MKFNSKSLDEEKFGETKMIFVRFRDRVKKSKDSLLFTLIIFRTPESYRLDKSLKIALLIFEQTKKRSIDINKSKKCYKCNRVTEYIQNKIDF